MWSEKERAQPDNESIAPEIRKLIGFAVLTGLVVALSLLTPLRESLSVEKITEWGRSLGVWGPLVVFALGCVTPMILLPRWPIAFVSGLLYGIPLGTGLAVIASTCGALLLFSLAKGGLSPLATKLRLKYRGRAEVLAGQGTFMTLLLVRMFPFGNFIATNLISGALNIRPRVFVAATALGMIPSTAMYACWGRLMHKPSAGHYYTTFCVVLIIALTTLLLRKRFQALAGGRDEG